MDSIRPSRSVLHPASHVPSVHETARRLRAVLHSKTAGKGPIQGKGRGSRPLEEQEMVEEIKPKIKRSRKSHDKGWS
jgi:hypothetical protein